MARVLWISDAGRPTGFSTVTHALAERLAAMGHDIHVLAVGWDAKFPYEGPLKLYRAEAGPAHSYLGYDRTAELIQRLEPDLVFVNEDPAMLVKRLFENRYDPNKLLLKNQPVVAYLPIDGYDVPIDWINLKQVVTVIPYTRFAADALEMDTWMHHGVDPVWRPLPAEERLEIRESFGIPADTFVVGRIDTNSGRKDWGSTWKVIDTALAEGLDENTTMAVFHTKLASPQSGVDLKALISRGRGKYLVTNEEGWPVEDLVRLTNCFDVTLSTSRGEGWGLNLAQSLACGVPVIATNCSAITEVVGPGGMLVEGVARMTNPYGVDMVLADVDAMSVALRYMQQRPDRRAEYGGLGLLHVKQYTWDASAAHLNQVFTGLVAQT